MVCVGMTRWFTYCADWDKAFFHLIILFSLNLFRVFKIFRIYMDNDDVIAHQYYDEYNLGAASTLYNLLPLLELNFDGIDTASWLQHEEAQPRGPRGSPLVQRTRRRERERERERRTLPFLDIDQNVSKFPGGRWGHNGVVGAMQLCFTPRADGHHNASPCIESVAGLGIVERYLFFTVETDIQVSPQFER